MAIESPFRRGYLVRRQRVQTTHKPAFLPIIYFLQHFMTHFLAKIR